MGQLPGSLVAPLFPPSPDPFPHFHPGKISLRSSGVPQGTGEQIGASTRCNANAARHYIFRCTGYDLPGELQPPPPFPGNLGAAPAIKANENFLCRYGHSWCPVGQASRAIHGHTSKVNSVYIFWGAHGVQVWTSKPSHSRPTLRYAPQQVAGHGIM